MAKASATQSGAADLRRLMEVRLPHSQERVKGLSRAEMAIDRLERRAVGSVTDVLMVEAGAAAGYFTAWRGLPLLSALSKVRPAGLDGCRGAAVDAR